LVETLRKLRKLPYKTARGVPVIRVGEANLAPSEANPVTYQTGS
jgi:hypothetical protein